MNKEQRSVTKQNPKVDDYKMEILNLYTIWFGLECGRSTYICRNKRKVEYLKKKKNLK